MKTGLHKKQKETAIMFDESSEIIDVFTHNTGLRKRLLEYAEKYPEYCRLTDSDEKGGMRFEIRKGRLSFRLTAPYSEDRRKNASEYAKKHGLTKRRNPTDRNSDDYDADDDSDDGLRKENNKS